MAKDFENAKTERDEIYYSRYIASWHRMGGLIWDDGLFEQWLREDQHLTEPEINSIMWMATNGKMELEHSAWAFMNKRKGTKEYENEVLAFRPAG